MEYKFIWCEFDEYLYICRGDLSGDSYAVINHPTTIGIGKANTDIIEIPNNNLLNILFGLSSDDSTDEILKERLDNV